MMRHADKELKASRTYVHRESSQQESKVYQEAFLPAVLSREVRHIPSGSYQDRMP